MDQSHVVARYSSDIESHLYSKRKATTDVIRSQKSIQWQKENVQKHRKIIFDKTILTKLKIEQCDSHSKPEMTTGAPDW